jgi:hypothetical protein
MASDVCNSAHDRRDLDYWTVVLAPYGGSRGLVRVRL